MEHAGAGSGSKTYQFVLDRLTDCKRNLIVLRSISLCSIQRDVKALLSPLRCAPVMLTDPFIVVVPVSNAVSAISTEEGGDLVVTARHIIHSAVGRVVRYSCVLPLADVIHGRSGKSPSSDAWSC